MNKQQKTSMEKFEYDYSFITKLPTVYFKGIIMSKLTQTLSFDFSLLANQGAYLSSYTPHSVQDYFRPIVIPQQSSYHLVGCHNPPLIARCHLQSILMNYLNVSSQLKNQAIIDLCLPYHDLKLRKKFLGRYIIFKGKLFGIRLSTASNRINSTFSSWPRHRANTILLKSQGNQYSVVIGEISLNLLNVRIGLLFQSEIQTSAQEYMNYGFDFISLSYEAKKHSNAALSLKNDLSKQIIFLQSDVGIIGGNICEENIQKLLHEKQSSLENNKGTIFMDYYQFSKGFSNKRLLYLSQRELTFITPVEIQTSLMRKKAKNINLNSDHYKMSLRRFSIFDNIENSKSRFSKYLKRLHMYLSRCNFQKIVLMLQDSPCIICFLYILEEIIQQNITKQPIDLIQSFKFIDLSNSHITTFLGGCKLLNFQNGWLEKEQKRDQTAHLIKTLDFITQSQAKQNYFPLLTADQQIVNVLRMLNQREQIKLERGEGSENLQLSSNSSCQCLTKKDFELKTWIATEFFTEEQVTQLYFQPKIKQIIKDESYYLQLWQRYKNQRKTVPHIQTIDDKEIDNLGIKLLNQSEQIHILLQQDSLIMHQFEDHFAKVKQTDFTGSKSKVFSHFLFRKFMRIEPHSSTNQLSCNIPFQLLLASEENMIKIFKFITHRTPAPLEQLTSRITLNSIAYAREEAERKVMCHVCEFAYFSELMYTCKTQICQESFCYECLAKFHCFDEQSLPRQSTGDIRRIKLCPVCLGLCLNCKNCQLKKERLRQKKLRYINFMEAPCHYCKKTSAMYQYACFNQKCRNEFCLRCIQQCFRVRTTEHQGQSWLCFACQNRCYCNSCELQKTKLMSLALDRPKSVLQQQKKSQKRVLEKQQIEKQKIKGISTQKVQPIQRICSLQIYSNEIKHIQNDQETEFMVNKERLTHNHRIKSQINLSIIKTKRNPHQNPLNNITAMKQYQDQDQEQTCLQKPSLVRLPNSSQKQLPSSAQRETPNSKQQNQCEG